MVSRNTAAGKLMPHEVYVFSTAVQSHLPVHPHQVDLFRTGYTYTAAGTLSTGPGAGTSYVITEPGTTPTRTPHQLRLYRTTPCE